MSTSPRKKYYEDITKRLNVKASDEKLYIVAGEYLSAYQKCTDALEEKELSEGLQRIEGILWERHRQLKFWISTMINKRGLSDEISSLIERKKKCLAIINELREIRGKEPYGHGT